jgi:hypothetical protein
MFIRQVDVYAAYLAYTDHEIGARDPGRRKHWQALQHHHHLYQRRQRFEHRRQARRHAERGCSLNGVHIPVEDQLKYFYDVWGSDQTYNRFSFSGRNYHIIGVQTGASLIAETVLRFRLQRSGGIGSYAFIRCE